MSKSNCQLSSHIATYCPIVKKKKWNSDKQADTGKSSSLLLNWPGFHMQRLKPCKGNPRVGFIFKGIGVHVELPEPLSYYVIFHPAPKEENASCSLCHPSVCVLPWGEDRSFLCNPPPSPGVPLLKSPLHTKSRVLLCSGCCMRVQADQTWRKQTLYLDKINKQ